MKEAGAAIDRDKILLSQKLLEIPRQIPDGLVQVIGAGGNTKEESSRRMQKGLFFCPGGPRPACVT